MSRNASGTHSLPAGNPVVTGTAISSTVHNATQSDFSAEITDSLSRSGKGGMTAPLRCADGSVSAPAHSFTSETGTGFYRAGANDVRLAVSGTDRYKQTATGATFTGTLTATGAGSFFGAAMGSQKITALANGTVATDAAAYGQVVQSSVISSASSGTFSTSSGTFVDVTNATATVTTSGRAVIISVQPDGSANGMNIAVATAAGYFQILRDSTVVGTWGSSPVAGCLAGPQIVESPAAGTYTYKLQAYSNAGAGTVYAQYVKLSVLAL